MIRFAKYDITTGAILSFMFTTSPDMVDMQCGPGEEFYLNCSQESGATHIINNEPVTIIPEATPPTLGEVKEAKLIEIRTAAARAMELLASPYLPQERESWDTQYKEATEWLADNSSSVPMITAMANNRGIPIAEMVAKVMENANLYRDTIGALLGKQQALLDGTAEATTVEEVKSIVWQ